MKTILSIGIALGLLASACKKDDKDAKGGQPASGTGSQAKPPVGSGSASASGSGSASASGSGSASASGSGSSVAAADEVKLTWKTEAVGSKVTKQELGKTDAIVTTKGGPVPLIIDEVTLRHTEVVEASEFVDKVKVHYEQDHKVINEAGKETTKASPVEGKRYIIWHDQQQIAATHEDGSAVDAAELEALTDSFRNDLGRAPGIAMVLISRGWKVGETVTLEGDDRALIAADLKKGATVKSATVTLGSAAGSEAVFAIELAVDVKGNLEGSMAATITATVDTTAARLLAIELDGTVDAVTKGMPFKGTVTGTETFTYQ